MLLSVVFNYNESGVQSMSTTSNIHKAAAIHWRCSCGYEVVGIGRAHLDGCLACWCERLLLPCLLRRLAPVNVLQQVPPAPDEVVIRKLPAIWVYFAEALQEGSTACK